MSNVPEPDRTEGASHRGRRAAYPPGWGAPTTTGPVTPPAESPPPASPAGSPAGSPASPGSSSPGSYRGRRAAYPPSEPGGTTEFGAAVDPDREPAMDPDGVHDGVHDAGAGWAPADSWTDANGRAEYDEPAATETGDPIDNGTYSDDAAASWQDPLTSDPLDAPRDQSPERWTTHSRRDEPATDGGFEDPLGLAPAWTKPDDRTDADADASTGARHQTNFDRQLGDADVGASDGTSDGGAYGAADAGPAARSVPPDAWEVATGRTDPDYDLPASEPAADERTISSVWERDFTQTTTMWGRYDSEPVLGAAAPAVPGAAGVDLSETGIADHGTTGVTGVGATDPALHSDALGSNAPALPTPAPAAPGDVLGRFDLDEPLTGTAPIQSYSGAEPPWMRYGAADDLSLTEPIATAEPVIAAPVSPSHAPESAPEARAAIPPTAPTTGPAVPPPAEPRTPRSTRRPLWRDEAEPELPVQQIAAPRSAPAERRPSAAVEDTAERRRSSGLPGLAAIVLGLGVTVGAGVFDLFWTGELGLLFSVCFGLVAFGVAASIRRSDIFTAAVLPPLELLLTLVTLGLIAPERLNPSAANQLEAILSALAASWITLVAAVLITFGVLVIRWALGPRQHE